MGKRGPSGLRRFTCQQCKQNHAGEEQSRHSPGLCWRCCPYPLRTVGQTSTADPLSGDLRSSWGHAVARTTGSNGKQLTQQFGLRMQKAIVERL